ncbi:hypothetical protein LVJ82_01250 [Vitreoscilla massiliensis]|uniref:Uncharacterized protein n=1 Tax=Vitreoscilla massiliensis TaxID=1689272 RepID=A0ABY4E289_9NEIS|nr:hypothetical protein [Vitreoscilla massiliensis]UOO89642.1 hypothetical protein LVJ82_01250 [Vitreoscilla massiliensis]
MSDAYESTVVAVANQDLDEVMSVKEWLITLLILCIPLVNIIMMFVWGFGSATKPTKANFCKAYLIITAIFVVLYVLLIMVIGIGAAASSAAG